MIKKEHWIVGVMGKTGSGKSFLAKQILRKQRRYIVIDPLREYPGVIFDDWRQLIQAIGDMSGQSFRFVFRPPEGREEAEVEKVFAVMNQVNDYTAVIEEADNWCNPHIINDDFARLMKYGRHGRRNILWISRNPAEVNRTLTRLSHAMITYRQTEPIDLQKLRQYSWDKEISTLEKYKWAWNGDAQIITKLTGLVT